MKANFCLINRLVPPPHGFLLRERWSLLDEKFDEKSRRERISRISTSATARPALNLLMAVDVLKPCGTPRCLGPKRRDLHNMPLSLLHSQE